MADQRITELTAYTPAISTDVVPVVDITTTTTKKITVGNLLSQVDTSPTELKLSTASKAGVHNGGFEIGTPDTAATADGWIVDAKYGWYFDEVATEASAEFDSAIIYRGKQSLLIQAIDATGTGIVYNTQGVTLPILGMEAVPLKVSTTYRLSAWVKTNAGVGANGAYLDIAQYDSAAVVGTTSTTGKLSASQNWTLVSVTFTSDNDAVYGRIGIHNDVAGAVSNAWFDNVVLEEIVTDTTYTGRGSEKVRPVLQAVTSVDNIDQSLDTGGAYANTYAVPGALAEGATHRQTFTPTKKYLTRIGVWVVEAGTGINWEIDVHDASNNLLGSISVASTTLTEGIFNYWDVPCTWASGAYHFHVWVNATTGTPTVKSNTSNDLEDASFIQNYAKKSEGFTLITNGIKTEAKTDKDGVLTNSVIDLDNGKYWYSNKMTVSRDNGESFANDVFSASIASRYSVSNTLIAGWNCGGDANGIFSNTDVTVRTMVVKVNTILPIKKLSLNTAFARSANFTFQISIDNVNWTTLMNGNASEGVYQKVSTDIAKGSSVFYVRWSKDATNAFFTIQGLEIDADLDTSKVPTGLFYPIALNQVTETVKLPANATRVYYRLAKFTNEDGAVVPSLEFTDASALYVGNTPLKLDNSQEANPCVDIITAQTTNGQQTGTGSNDSTTGYILNDGEYMTLSTAVAEIKIVYKIGTGTTTFADITKNTYFLTSLGESDDATQDPSHQFNAVLGIRQQGLIQRLSDIGNEIALVREGVVKTSSWAEWVPTLTWTTGTPATNVVTKARYKVVDGVCSFTFYYTADDGNAASALTISLPVLPKDNDSLTALQSQQKVDTTWSNPLAYIDDGATTITFRSLSACTDTKAVIIMVSGNYEI